MKAPNMRSFGGFITSKDIDQPANRRQRSEDQSILSNIGGGLNKVSVSHSEDSQNDPSPANEVVGTVHQVQAEEAPKWRKALNTINLNFKKLSFKKLKSLGKGLN